MQMDDKGRLRWVVVLTAVGSFMAALDTLVVASALSTIKRDLDASLTDLEWTVNAYNLSFAVLLVPAAVLGDRLGRARTTPPGWCCSRWPRPAARWPAASARWSRCACVQGAGAALVMTLGLALLTSAFPPERRGAALGLFSAVTGLAVASGPLVGGAVVDGLAWQWIFWLNVPVGLVAAPLALRLIPEMRGARQPARRARRGAARPAACSASSGPWCAAAPAGWTSAEVLGAAPPGSLLLGGVRRLGAPGAAPAAAAAAAAPARLHRRQRRHLPHLRLAVLRGVLLRPAAAGRARVTSAAGGRRAADGVDGHLPRGRAGRRRPGRPDRRTRAAHRRARRSRRRDAVVRRHGRRPTMSYLDMLGPFVVGGVGVSMAIPCGQSAVVAAVADRDVATASGVNSHDARAGRRVRHRRDRRGLRGRRRLRDPGRVRRRLPRPRCSPRPGSRRSARWPGRHLPGGRA